MNQVRLKYIGNPQLVGIEQTVRDDGRLGASTLPGVVGRTYHLQLTVVDGVEEIAFEQELLQ